jgi:hypothetical protein
VSTELGAAQRRLAIRTCAVLGLLAVPAAALGAALVGWQGAASATIGLGFVAVLFGVSALALARVADRRTSAGLVALLGGALGRIALYAVSLSLLTRVAWIHRPSLAITTGAAVAIVLALELRWLATTPRLFWIDAEASRPTAISHATGS